jgi:hypothetical protein
MKATPDLPYWVVLLKEIIRDVKASPTVDEIPTEA